MRPVWGALGRVARKGVNEMAKRELPLAPIDRLVRRAGAARVSSEATAALRDILEDLAVSIGKSAVELARHSKRTTVVEDDIKLAFARWQ